MKFIDLHCDTISAIEQKRLHGKAACLKENTGHVDLARLKKGECLGQNFALFTLLKREADPYGYAQKLLQIYKEEMEANAEWIRPARSVSELLANESEGKMSGILTIEEGAVCCGDTRILHRFYEEGVRMMTLTWNFENDLAFPNRIDWAGGRCEPELERGLKPKGIEFVEQMEELGMAVDVSHLGDAGFWDVVKVTKKPFAASHSNARAEAPHVRNLTDAMIRALSERGGVIGINFCAAFLNEAEAAKPDGGCSRISDMLRHIRHIRNIGGMDCLALGSDFDGMEGELELDSPAALVRLEEALYRAGFKQEEIEKLFWKNALRFYREVWKEDDLT